MPESMLGCRVTQSGQLPNRGFWPQDQCFLVHPRHRFEKRAVEQLGVQAANPMRIPLDLGAQDSQGIQTTVGSHVRGAGQPTQRFLVVRRRQGVCALELL